MALSYSEILTLPIRSDDAPRLFCIGRFPLLYHNPSVCFKDRASKSGEGNKSQGRVESPLPTHHKLALSWTSRANLLG